ncbi:hypothetical protein E8E12_008338 [Didymella heteroderae]|uniref:F-box domain-containing protein n=1 Tax=Didymella heteroderae TaxID=1769908 RepID=A0A9P4WR73_9PLEO|nr:hypothetical protein E8E12_008338 [Didymella heteroderae]
MAQLLDLSTELIWCIAGYLDQVDLLNITLTCKFLKDATEKELYREYNNPRLYGRPLATFVYRILERPEIAKYVTSLDCKDWDTMERLDPSGHEPIGFVEDPDNYEHKSKNGESLREWKAVSFDECEIEGRLPRPIKEQYTACTEAARASGLIQDIWPYENESVVMCKARTQLSTDFPERDQWYLHLFDETIATPDIKYDRKFCQLLNAGIEDAFQALLLALLPNLKHVILRGITNDPRHCLGWPKPAHAFKAMRQLAIGSTDSQLTWGIGYIDGMLAQAQDLDTLHLQGAGSWYLDTLGEREWDDLLRPLHVKPGSLPITKLELDRCALLKSDMETLVLACPQLRSLYYWTGPEETGPENFTAGELIEILEPLKDTLEELYTEIQTYWIDFVSMEGRIDTMSQFTALKILDTTPDMWWHLPDDQRSLWQIEDDQRISKRLPPSLEIVRFHRRYEYIGYDDGSMSDVPDVQQIRDLIVHRQDMLPHLKEIFFGSNWAAHARKIKYVIDMHADLVGDLKIDIEVGTKSGGPTRSLWSDLGSSHGLPQVKWQDNKYGTVIPEVKFSRNILAHGREKTDAELMNDELRRQEALFACGLSESSDDDSDDDDGWGESGPTFVEAITHMYPIFLDGYDPDAESSGDASTASSDVSGTD